MPDTDRWGHPWVEENTKDVPAQGSQRAKRQCRHCLTCMGRATRAGLTLAEYYAAHPETLPYNGFPVIGARIGRTSGLG